MKVFENALMLATMVFYFYLISGLADLTEAIKSDKVQVDMKVKDAAPR